MMMGIKNSIYLIFTLLLLLTNVYGRRSLVKQTKSSILSSFEKYIRKRLKKTDPGPNIICTKPGTKPKSLVCYNTGGEQNCVARQEAYEKYEQYKQDKAKSSGRSLYRHERRTYNINIDQMLEASRHVPPECPSPCGCWLVCLLSRFNLFHILKAMLSYFFVTHPINDILTFFSCILYTHTHARAHIYIQTGKSTKN